MKLIRVGVDLSKHVFQVHGIDWREQPAWRCKLADSELKLPWQQRIERMKVPLTLASAAHPEAGLQA